MPSKPKKKPLNSRELVKVRFNRLVVIRKVTDAVRAKRIIWECLCRCKKLHVTSGESLLKGATQSCGCLCKERTSLLNRTHGKKGTRVYRIWSGMLNRCRNPNSKDYCRYGGAGVTVCPRWESFENFYKDMGEPPTKTHSIHRKSNDKGYNKDNCVWATPKQQAQARKNTLFLTVDGVVKPVHEWSELSGIPATTLWSRVHRSGWDHSKAVSTPVNGKLNRYKTIESRTTRISRDQ